MRAFDPDDFDLHTVAQPYRDRPVGGQALCTGCKHSHLYRRQGHQADRAAVRGSRPRADRPLVYSKESRRSERSER